MTGVDTMKPISLQLVTVKLDNGQQSTFIGTPLIASQREMHNSQISEIWFSDIRDLSDQLKLEELMDLVKSQLSHHRQELH